MTNDSGVTTPVELPVKRSHSQLETFLACGRRYELERLKKVRSRPGTWLPGGSAVHKVIERYLRENA